MKELADRTDRALDLQTKVIEDQSKEIQTLRARLNDEIAYSHILSRERDDLLGAGDDVAENYRKYWVEQGNGNTTPPSVCRWNSVVERNGL